MAAYRVSKQTPDILDLYSSLNAAELLDNETLKQIASTVIADYEEDKASRAEFDQMIDAAMKIAKQVIEAKNTPWPGASNVKYPLVTTAAIQYAARTYPEVIRNNKVVETAVLGDDPEGIEAARAHRVSQHMSAQLIVQDSEWEWSFDRLIHVLPVVGTVFKKTYWDELEKRNRSIMCAPKDIVVNNHITSIESARRITHVIPMYLNDIVSRIRFGIYCDVEDELRQAYDVPDPKASKALGPQEDTIKSEHELTEKSTQNKVLEQHRYLDLDKDGYEEPYIVTVHVETQKVLRILRCWDGENVYMNADGKIWKIDRTEYFTDFHFIPSPDGSFYSMGFGQYLLPLNTTINTTINQLLDAGTNSNQQSGLLGRGFKTKSGSLYVAPGEWKKVDVAGDDLQRNIFPMPIREPSNVLFQLLGLMIQTGKELSSVSDILQGQQPAQNVPATTVLALIEQGLKVFSAIQKRLFRSLTKEFKKLYRLNSLYLEDTLEYKDVLKTLVIFKEDYSSQNLSVFPVSDPSMSSDAQRMARARAMLDLIPMVPQAGAQEIIRNYLDALQTPTNQIATILNTQDPNGQPSPAEIEQQKAQQELQMQNANLMETLRLKAEDLHIKDIQTQSQAQLNAQLTQESAARVEKMRMDAAIAAKKVDLENEHKHIDFSIKAVQKLDDLKDEHRDELKQKAAEEEKAQSGNSTR